jgi:hypothetical protein
MNGLHLETMVLFGDHIRDISICKAAMRRAHSFTTFFFFNKKNYFTVTGLAELISKIFVSDAEPPRPPQ